MRRLFTKGLAAVDATFGQCAKCMRLSLAAAVAAWGLYLIVVLVWPQGLLHLVVGLSALGLSALWALHVAAYAARVATAARGSQGKAPEHPPIPAPALATSAAPAHHTDRRMVLGLLLKAAGIAVLASVALLPRNAGAQSCDCGPGQNICPGCRCCPGNMPHYCPSTNYCYTYLNEAMADCGNSWQLCGVPQ